MSRLGRGFPIQPLIVGPPRVILFPGTTMAVTGTATDTIDEDNVTDGAGGGTVILTLTSDQWVTAAGA